MGRNKKQKTLVAPEWLQTLRTRFLAAGFYHCPDALGLLVKEFEAGHRTGRDWAVQFDVTGTWIELWAEETLEFWRNNPQCIRPAPQVTSVQYFYPPPSSKGASAPGFSFTISETRLPCKFAVGTLVGGSLPDELGEDQMALSDAERCFAEAVQIRHQSKGDAARKQAESKVEDARIRLKNATQRFNAEGNTWEWFKKSMHNRLDTALEQYRVTALSSGAAVEIKIPSEIQLKIEVAAIYTFGGRTPREISELDWVRRDATVVYRWLREILPLMNLKTRKAGLRLGR